MNIAAYPKYDSYQEVKISWCEELPSHWTTQPIRNLFTESRRKNGDGKNKDYLSLMANRGIIPYSEKGDVGNKMPADLSGCKLVDVDDFVLNSMNFGIGSFGVSSLKGVCSSVYVILKANNPASIKYYERIFQHPQFQTFSQSLGNGILAHRCAIGWDELKNAHFPVPPVEEIQAIAAFLDGKCATIDEAVRIKEEQIRLLAERRQILIQEAVTRGLNPDAPMKDSGIDWIGQIPAHWEVKRLKHLGTPVIGLTYDPKDLCDADEGTLVLRSSNLQGGRFTYGDDLNVYVSMRIPEKLTIKRDDILICSRNGSRDLIGKCALATEQDCGASFGAFTTVFRSPINRYLFQILNSEIFKLLAGSFLTATINQLTTSNLNSIYVPVPPPAEQAQLTDYLETLNAKVRDAIALKQSQITALREYKTSLINAAVTGKIKVL